jgi:hypothetical protein
MRNLRTAIAALLVTTTAAAQTSGQQAHPEGLYVGHGQAFLFAKDTWVACTKLGRCSKGTYTLSDSRIKRESHSWWASEDFKRDNAFTFSEERIRITVPSFDKADAPPSGVFDPRKAKFLSAEDIRSRYTPGAVKTDRWEIEFRPDGSYTARDYSDPTPAVGTWTTDPAGFVQTRNASVGRTFRYVFYEYEGVVYINQDVVRGGDGR